MDTWNDLPQLTGDGLTTRRILSLAIALINAHRPPTTAELRRDLYPDMQRDAFKKAFLRDRERLALAGLVVKQGVGTNGEATWYIDEEVSFVRENDLTREDALLLDFLLLPLAQDPSLPYARDLQVALTKIDRSFDGSTEVALRPEARVRSKALSILEDALVLRQAVHIVYRRSDGSIVERDVAPFGLFSFRSRAYLVAARVGEDGRLDASDPHTYRIERVVKAAPRKKVSYEIPADFDVRDFVKLPFQMGEPITTGTFVNPKEGGVRTEEIHDLGLAAAWALSKGLVPTTPKELVGLWKQRVDHMRATLPSWKEHVARARKACSTGGRGRRRKKGVPRVRRGRPRNNEQIRELVALIGSLHMTGDTITLEAVSKRLGISEGEAREVMEIVCEAGGEESGGLLISSNDDETEFTLQYPGIHGRPVKLTQTETIAVLRGLDAAGIGDTDPLRGKLSSSLTSSEVQIAEVRRALGAPAHPAVLAVCAKAQARGRSISFMYRGAKDPAPRKRRAVVRALNPQGDDWLVHCYDIDLGQERTFRTDRMTCVSLGDPSVLPSTYDDDQTLVEAYFTDALYYHVFDWYHMSEQDVCNDIIHMQLPYYGKSSTWLPRRIIACDATFFVDDGAVMEAAERYLDEIDKAAGAHLSDQS